MLLKFTKMQGAGNDFVVLDETRGRFPLSAAHYRRLADRHYGVGADQILSVRPAPTPDTDFEYVIHNADGSEVEHCGNGARCFVRFVQEQGLCDKARVRVKVHGGVIELQSHPDGQVSVDMGPPRFDLGELPFNPQGLAPRPFGDWQRWPLALADGAGPTTVEVAVLSMGNPHAVLLVDDVDTAPVLSLGPLIERHPAFPRRVNAGFMQVLDRASVRLRVYERGAGETLACGTGACAAVVAGIRLGLLEPRVQVQARGGRLTIEWQGLGAPVHMSGPAVTVFQGSINLPDFL